jgi:outer membrane lipoprotein SlyB
MKMHKTVLTSALAAVLLATFSHTSWAQRAGQSVTIQYGKVTGVRDVDLNSGAVPAGALVGGSLGIMSGSGKSSGKKARKAIVGAAAGSAIAGAAQGSQKGALYQIDAGPNGVVQVVSDQREIRTGDCVAVEKAGDTANVRRVSESFCQKANEAAVNAVADVSKKEAEECASVKQQLVDAATPQEADLASRKIALLCND